MIIIPEELKREQRLRREAEGRLQELKARAARAGARPGVRRAGALLSDDAHIIFVDFDLWGRGGQENITCA